jgi:hypothetical protein
MASDPPQKVRSHEERYRHAFWCWLLEHAEQKLSLHSGRKPGYWRHQSASLSVPGVGFDYVLRRRNTAVELYLQRKDPDENQALFEQLLLQKTTLEQSFGAELEWAPLPRRTGCRIRFQLNLGGWEDPGRWPVVIPVTVDTMVRFSATLTVPVLECATTTLVKD